MIKIEGNAWWRLQREVFGESGLREQSLEVTPQLLRTLRVKIEVAAALHRDLAPPEMTSALRGMQSQEKDALADYISRLGNADVLLDSNRPVAEGR